MHGDLYAEQTDVSGRDYFERGLFGDIKIIDTIKLNPDSDGICAYQDWSQFLLASLKYAQKIGMARMPEIVNWREVLESIGGVGTATAECMLGESSDFGFDLLLKSSVLSNDEEIKTFPILIFGGHDAITLPYVQNERLVYLRKNKKGEYDFNTPFVRGRYSKVIEYIPEDLPDVLKATYKYFARDRTLLPKIMDWFNMQPK